MYNRPSCTCCVPTHGPLLSSCPDQVTIVFIRLPIWVWVSSSYNGWDCVQLWNASFIINFVFYFQWMFLPVLAAVCQKPSVEPARVSCSSIWEPNGGSLSNLTLAGNWVRRFKTVTVCMCFRLCAWVAILHIHRIHHITGRALVFMLCHGDLSRHPKVSVCLISIK